MATKMSTLPIHAESMFLPSSACSRSKFLFTSYLQKTAFGHSNRPHPHSCFFYITVPTINSYRYIKLRLAMEASQQGPQKICPSFTTGYRPDVNSLYIIANSGQIPMKVATSNGWLIQENLDSLLARRMELSVRSMMDESSSSDPPGSSTNNGTRLVRAIRLFQAKLNARIKELRKGLSMKILFFFVGFYCATAFATVIGQTGDWDILSAGLAVVVVEGIGALMYRASFRFLNRVKGLITVFNYWKAGLSLGLFLDSFKYEMGMLLESCNPFSFDIDVFPMFW